MTKYCNFSKQNTTSISFMLNLAMFTSKRYFIISSNFCMPTKLSRPKRGQTLLLVLISHVMMIVASVFVESYWFVNAERKDTSCYHSFCSMSGPS